MVSANAAHWLLIIICAAGLVATAVEAVEPENDLPYPSRDALNQALKSAASDSDTRRLDAIWNTLEERKLIPFIDGESVLFLYRGDSKAVSFAGDFNGWEPGDSRAKRLKQSDVWLYEDTFPEDSRLDYKIVLNDSEWILDPSNDRVQRSGFGDNSELRMPAYEPSPWVIRRDDVPAGTITHASLASDHLGHRIAYQVYTPPGYENLEDLPVMYVTDGHEYADDRTGGMVPVLDNLINAGRLSPMIAVFIDMRVDGRNIRSDLLIMNPAFVRCVVEELVPTVDRNYRTSTDRWNRGMLGTSLGGLNAAWFGCRAPETFGRIAIQSPAFHAGEGRILDHFRDAPRSDVDIFMSWGTFHDFGSTSVQFRKLLDDKGYDYGMVVVNEGHSWGNWRALLDDALLRFWPIE